MGDKPSSQAGTEEEEPERAEAKNWDPDNPSDSGDEDAPETQRNTIAEEEPGPIFKPQPESEHRDASKLGEEKEQKARIIEESERAQSSDKEEATTHGYGVTTTTLEETPPEIDAPDFNNDSDESSSEPLNGGASPANDPHNSRSRTREQSRSNERGFPTPKPSSVKSRKVNDRCPCPKAKTYGCDKTFATSRSAARHVQTHSKQSFKCIVCAKILSRADKLKQHQKRLHSQKELEDAMNSNRHLAPSDDEEIQEGGEQGEPKGVLQQHSDRSSRRLGQSYVAESLQEIRDDALATSTSRDAVVNDNEAQSSTKASTVSDSLFDEPVNIDVVKETPRPRSRLKRKPNVSSERLSSQLPSDRPHKRRRRHSWSPPTSVASSDEETVGRAKESADNAGAVPSSSVPRTTKLKPAKLGNLDNFAMPMAPGSQLYHPIHNPRSPRIATRQRVQIVGPQSSFAESSTRTKSLSQVSSSGLSFDQLVGRQTPLVNTGRKVSHTSPKGKRRAKDSVQYSLPQKVAAVIEDREAPRPEGMATSVARRGNASQGNRKRPKKEAEETKVSDEEGQEGRKGQFSAREVRKLHKWRESCCEEYGINIPTFNQMMTDSSRRIGGHTWPYRFVTRAEFLKDYYDVLPDRNRRSMHRYRERAFQNVPSKQEWTTKDDEELTRLVKEIGQKWVEIGQLMTRTQDSVSQRWRFKLQWEGEVNQGEWPDSEEEKLKQAVAQVKRESGLSLDPTADVRVPWDRVSRKLESKRTPQQCSNKWRLMYYERQGNKFVKPSEAKTESTSRTNTTTPSKIQQRLSGQTPSLSKSASARKRKAISEEIVNESDDEDSSDDEQTKVDMADSESLQAEAMSPSHNALRKKTLQKARNVINETKTLATRRSGPTPQTPRVEMELMQAFNQTQANTSVSKALDSISRPHTQTEMPTPGIPIKHRPASSSSSWRAINRNRSRADTSHSDIDSDKETGSHVGREDGDILAEPQTSDDNDDDDDDDDIQGFAGIQEGDSEQTNSEVDELEESDAGVETESEPENPSSRSSSAARSISEDSARSTSDESENEALEEQMSKDKFLRSLARQRPVMPHVPKANTSASRKGERTLMANVLAKTGSQTDSESDSEDEGDIAHH